VAAGISACRYTAKLSKCVKASGIAMLWRATYLGGHSTADLVWHLVYSALYYDLTCLCRSYVMSTKWSWRSSQASRWCTQLLRRWNW